MPVCCKRAKASDSCSKRRSSAGLARLDDLEGYNPSRVILFGLIYRAHTPFAQRAESSERTGLPVPAA